MQLSELRSRSSRILSRADHVDGEDVLVKDQRASLSPTQVVEQKLRHVLHTGVSFFAHTTRSQRS